MSPCITHNEDNTIDTNGTSLKGYLKGVRYDQLVAAFGEPHDLEGYKTDWEWDIQFPCGTVATVYNWKNGPNYCGDEGLSAAQVRTWNVGGHKGEALDLVREAVAVAGGWYHVIQVGCSYVAAPAKYLNECELVRSDLTIYEARSVLDGAACILSDATSRVLRELMKEGDISTLHAVVSLINDAHDEGYLKDYALAHLLGGEA